MLTMIEDIIIALVVAWAVSVMIADMRSYWNL